MHGNKSMHHMVGQRLKSTVFRVAKLPPFHRRPWQLRSGAWRQPAAFGR